MATVWCDANSRVSISRLGRARGGQSHDFELGDENGSPHNHLSGLDRVLENHADPCGDGSCPPIGVVTNFWGPKPSDDAGGMRDAVRDWLGSLSASQREQAIYSLDDTEERRTWAYWPTERRGLPLAQMDPGQQKAAYRLLSEALSLPAYAKACQIVALELVLDEVEGRTGSGRGLPRDPSLYYVTVFGSTDDDCWGWRFEGHHVSVHTTVVDGEVAVVPCFLGANPAVVRHEGRVVSRPLADEEDVARALVRSLDDAQRSRAIVSSDAPDDILTMNAPEVGELPPDGLPATDLREEQRTMLESLVDVYLGRSRTPPGPVDAEELVFAWAGSIETGERHYYRITGRTLVIEYDNTQDDANHIHAVWRDRERDFGSDLLREHLARDHAG